MQGNTGAPNRVGLWAFIALASLAAVVVAATFLLGDDTPTEVSTSNIAPEAQIQAVDAVAVEEPVALQAASFEPFDEADQAPELASGLDEADSAAAEEATGDDAAGSSDTEAAASTSSDATETVATAASTETTAGAAADTSADAAAAAPTAGLAGTPDASGQAPAAPAGNAARAVSAAEAFTYVAFSQVGVLPIYDAPGGNQIQPTYQYLDGTVINYPLNGTTYFGNSLALRVVEGGPESEWLRVQLPVRPNGQTAWVSAADVSLGSSDVYVQINVSNNTVSVWQGETLVANTAAVTGTSSTPTPLLSTFVDEKMGGPNSAYGPYLLSLGAYSNAHNQFGGGLPKLALHGTDQPGLMGQYASNGCIRLPNDVITLLFNTVPVGSRVDIVG